MCICVCHPSIHTSQHRIHKQQHRTHLHQHQGTKPLTCGVRREDVVAPELRVHVSDQRHQVLVDVIFVAPHTGPTWQIVPSVPCQYRQIVPYMSCQYHACRVSTMQAIGRTGG
eukprot:2460800-Rhodomonas_salina.2